MELRHKFRFGRNLTSADPDVCTPSNLPLTLQMGIAGQVANCSDLLNQASPLPRRTAATDPTEGSPGKMTSARCTGGSQRAQTLSLTGRHEEPATDCHSGSQLSTIHSKIAGRDGGIRTRGLLLPKQRKRSFNFLASAFIPLFLQVTAI